VRFENSLVIDAPAPVVWDLTVDVTGWPALTATMQRVERLDSGPVRVGSRARVKQPAQAAAVWTVTDLEPGRRFVWQTTRLGMTMTASHLVEDLGGQCRNTLLLDVTGPGARLFGLLLGAAIRRSLAIENQGFRSRAQQLASGRGQDNP
jgi:uncharacterized membrane protein